MSPVSKRTLKSWTSPKANRAAQMRKRRSGARLFILSGGFEGLNLGEELIHQFAVHFVHAVPDAIEELDALIKVCQHFGEGMRAAAQFALVVAVGFEFGEAD